MAVNNVILYYRLTYFKSDIHWYILAVRIANQLFVLSSGVLCLMRSWFHHLSQCFSIPCKAQSFLCGPILDGNKTTDWQSQYFFIQQHFRISLLTFLLLRSHFSNNPYHLNIRILLKSHMRNHTTLYN